MQSLANDLIVTENSFQYITSESQHIRRSAKLTLFAILWIRSYHSLALFNVALHYTSELL